MTVQFDAAECVCEEPHAPSAHDDGFGCTVPGCPCLAGWSFAREGQAEPS